MSNNRKAYPLNAPGDFYVEDGCCTMCGVPGAAAPELFGGFAANGDASEDVWHCWVKRQPQTPAELEMMFETMARQELDCIRYRGTNPTIMARLREAGEGDKID